MLILIWILISMLAIIITLFFIFVLPEWKTVDEEIEKGMLFKDIDDFLDYITESNEKLH